MRPNDRAGRRPRPSFEALEPRDLPAPLPSPLPRLPRPRPAAGRIAAAENGGMMAGGMSMGGLLNGPLSMGEPTPHERARRAFFAAFVGPYVVGRGRTTAEAFQTALIGNGTSNKFLQGNLKLAFSTPTDPNGLVVGTAALFDQNYPQTSNVLVLDLQGQPAPDGRPTTLNWMVGEGSSGAFTNAQGQGTVELRYRPGGRRPARAVFFGRGGVKFRGELLTDPAINPYGAQSGFGLPR